MYLNTDRFIITDLLDTYPYSPPLLLNEPHLYNLYLDALLRQKQFSGTTKDGFAFGPRDKIFTALRDSEQNLPNNDNVSIIVLSIKRGQNRN